MAAFRLLPPLTPSLSDTRNVIIIVTTARYPSPPVPLPVNTIMHICIIRIAVNTSDPAEG